MKYSRFFRGVVASIGLIVFVTSSYVSLARAQSQSCSSIFQKPKVEAEYVARILDEAERSVRGLPSTNLVDRSQFELINAFGAREAISLFGADFDKWPMFFGATRGGHFILAKTFRHSQQIKIYSYKRLEWTSAEFEAPSKLKMEDLYAWAEKTQGDFNLTLLNFWNATNLWAERDAHHRSPVSGITYRSGFLRTLKHPWLIRSTHVTVPASAGRPTRIGTAAETLPLVNMLLGIESKQN